MEQSQQHGRKEKGTQKDWERQTQRRRGRHSERFTRVENGRYRKLLSRYREKETQEILSCTRTHIYPLIDAPCVCAVHTDTHVHTHGCILDPCVHTHTQIPPCCTHICACTRPPCTHTQKQTTILSLLSAPNIKGLTRTVHPPCPPLIPPALSVWPWGSSL